VSPYYADDWVTLYHGDCRELLPVVVPVGASSLILTDPQYGIDAARDRYSQQWGWRDYPAGG
jgi:hypothetical protein